MMRVFLFCAGSFFLLSSCIRREFDLNALRSPAEFSTEEATDVLVLYSDSARLRVRIEGPLLVRYIYRFKVEEEFPEGVHVTFYDEHERPSAWLDAKYAIRKSQEKQTIVQDSVVLFNTKRERLEGDELIWDENEELIYTDKFVIITTPEEHLTSYGFKSNLDFTKYTLYAVEGEMLLEDIGPKAEE